MAKHTKKPVVHHGPRGGRFTMTRKKDGGTKRHYLAKGERAHCS